MGSENEFSTDTLVLPLNITVAAGQNTILHALRKQNFTAWEEGKPAPTKAKQFISSNSPLQRAIWPVTVISLVREIGNSPNTHCHYTATNYSAPRWRYSTHTSVSCLISWVAVWWKKSSEKLTVLSHMRTGKEWLGSECLTTTFSHPTAMASRANPVWDKEKASTNRFPEAASFSPCR